MIIREARTSDYPSYCHLVQEVDALHVLNAPRYFRQPNPPGRPQQYFEGILADPSKAIFVSESGDSIQGYIHLSLEAASELAILMPIVRVQIHDIVVTKPLQRQGIGRALMQRAKAWAQEQGAKELSLSVSGFNDQAKAMYEAEGFHLVRSIMAFALDEEKPTLP